MLKVVILRIAYAVLMTARPGFLLLSLSVVFLGTAIAMYEGASWSLERFILIVLGALLAHLSVNLLNEYQDFRSGLDEITVKTPFSGGSGALVDNPDAAKSVKLAFITSVVGLVSVGLLLVKESGWQLAVFGLIGLALIIFYTQSITRMPWLCLIAPGTAFGPLMVMGSYYVWMDSLSFIVVLLALVPFFLVNNLLLLNQIPDIEADKKVGRYNVLMHVGIEDGLQIFAAFTWLAFIILGLVIWLFELPDLVWIGFLSLLIVFPMLRQLQENYQNVEKLLPVLAMNVIINLLTPVLIGAGLLVSMN